MSFTAKEDNKKPQFTRELMAEIGKRTKMDMLDREGDLHGGLSLIPKEISDEINGYDNIMVAGKTMFDEAFFIAHKALKASENASLSHVTNSDRSRTDVSGNINDVAADTRFKEYATEHSPIYATMHYIAASIYTKFGAADQIPTGETLEIIKNKLDGKLQYAGLNTEDIDAYFAVIDRTVDAVTTKHANQGQQKKMWF